MTKRDSGSRRRIDVGLLWHSVDSGNLGVGALTVGNIAIVRAAAASVGMEPHFRIIGFPGDMPAYVTGPEIEVVELNGKAMLPGGAYTKRGLAGLDCVLDIGAGDSFTDIYGAKRFAYLWLSKMVAVSRGLPLVLSPQTIGPFNQPLLAKLAAQSLRRADLVVARDPLSFEVARKMAPGSSILQAVDVAFALPYEKRKKANAKAVEVGVNVSGLLFNRGYTGSNEFGMQIDYAAYTRELISALLARPGVEVHLVSHVHTDTVPMDDDRRIVDALKAEFPTVVRAPDFISPSDAKSYISGLDFLVAGRMHACIAAFSSGVPVVPVAYSRKFSGLFDGVLGYRHMAPVTGMDTDTAVAFTLQQFEQRAALKTDIKLGMAKVDALLDGYRDALAGLFSRLGSG
jgi:polysaccharide pyruvyl transferase WcaK-like protein